MKVLFLFPPQWMPISPHFALPTLLGQFDGTEFDAEALDLNVEFYNTILDANFLKNSLIISKEKLKKYKEDIKKFYNPNNKFEDYTFEQQNKIAKCSMIQDTLAKYGPKLDKTSILINQAKSIFKSKNFYNPTLYTQALDMINTGLEIASMPYYPTQIGFCSYDNKMLKLDYETIKYYVFDKESNIFLDYYTEVLDKIKSYNADYIGISINSSNQIIAGLTLSNLLMKETNAHINIGGNHFGRVADALENHVEFFELFCHSLTKEEGEIPVFELARYVNNEITIDKVPNLMYKKDGKVISNPTIEPLTLNKMKMPKLNGYKLDQYFTPEIVMPFQTSRGCYWRKCSFCDHDFGMCYNIKDLDILISQIKYYIENYGITKFEFIDEAISPSYMQQMSERIIKEKLKIQFFCDARLEDGFDYPLLKLAHQAGLRMILWGYESGSKRIMKLINKGINIDNRLKILKDSNDAGVYNFAFIFFGFPAETKKEAIMTIDDICNNTNIIHSYGKSIFTMGKHTKLREAPEKYGVIGETKQEAEFSPTFNYEAVGMTKDELNDVINLCSKRANKAYGNCLSFHLLSREIMLLYIAKYGLKEVCNFKFEE